MTTGPDIIGPDAIVAVAWQGMLRRLEAGTLVERIPPTDRAILRRADLVGLSHLDVARDTSLGDLTRFLHGGARLLVTQGGHGGLLVTTGDDGPAEVLRYLPTPTEREVDPTGAGDTFLAALLAVLVRPSVAGVAGSVARAGTPLRRGGRVAGRRGRRSGRRPGSHFGAHPARAGAGAPRGRADACRPRSASRIRGSRGAGAAPRRPKAPGPLNLRPAPARSTRAPAGRPASGSSWGRSPRRRR